MSLPFELAESVWLAPLTVGGNVPFRRLCVEHGAAVTVGEMTLARSLLRGRASAFALLRHHPDEPCFGAQIAGRSPDILTEAARLAESRGARFVDLNCGCPIHSVTGRGFGAALMRKPGRLARLVEALVAAVSIPVTVKLRTGWREGSQNVTEVARLCEEAGASAIAVHGRSREQRYNRAADWALIGRVAAERGVPVVGNGDVLTHYEARSRLELSGVSSLMLGRGALIKPWLFREIREGRDWRPTAGERVAVLWRFVELLREHFGEGEKGAVRQRRFLAWHLDFFSRYRPLPEAEFGAMAEEQPLIHVRHPLGEGIEPLEALLRDPRPETHGRLADALLGASDLGEAESGARQLAEAIGVDRSPSRVEVGPEHVAG